MGLAAKLTDMKTQLSPQCDVTLTMSSQSERHDERHFRLGGAYDATGASGR
jgi:hypothetical protein